MSENLNCQNFPHVTVVEPTEDLIFNAIIRKLLNIQMHFLYCPYKHF